MHHCTLTFHFAGQVKSKGNHEHLIDCSDHEISCSANWKKNKVRLNQVQKTTTSGQSNPSQMNQKKNQQDSVNDQQLMTECAVQHLMIV